MRGPPRPPWRGGNFALTVDRSSMPKTVVNILGMSREEIEAILREATAQGVAIAVDSTGLEEHIQIEADDEERLAAVRDLLVRRLGDNYYGGEESLEGVVGQLLKERGATIALAESLTGGLICDRMTDISGSSKYLMAGLVVYSNESKVELLGVAEEVIRERGAVSVDVVRMMAEGARSRYKTTFGLAVTGIAGPTGGSPQKPVGTVFFGLATPEGTRVDKKLFIGDRRRIKVATSTHALDMLRRFLIRDVGRSPGPL